MKDSDFPFSHYLHPNSELLLFSSKKLFFWILTSDQQNNRGNMDFIRMGPKPLSGKICIFCHSLRMYVSQGIKGFCRIISLL